MSFTVIGASGFVGGHLTRHLRSRGAQCFAPRRGDAQLLSGNLGHVIYSAGFTNDFLKSPVDTVEAHVGLLCDLLRDGRFETLTYLSSTRLYDSGGGGQEGSDLVLNPNVPRHLFDLSKALGESLCLTSGQPGVRVARLACVYADDLIGENFLHRILRAARVGRNGSFDVAPDAARDYIHIDDVCALLVAIARRGRRPMYNVASGANVSNAELFSAVHRLSGCVFEANGSPCGRAAPLIEIAAIREDFGIRPAPVQGHLARVLDVPAFRGAA